MQSKAVAPAVHLLLLGIGIELLVTADRLPYITFSQITCCIAAVLIGVLQPVVLGTQRLSKKLDHIGRRSRRILLAIVSSVLLFGPHSTPHEEPVYNISAAWPDDCQIIRAHDLGDAENQKLFRYYAAIQPDRMVYRFDRDARTLQKLGPVSQLAVGSLASP